MTLALLGELSPSIESVHEPKPHLLTESFLAHRGDVGGPEFWDAVVAEARDWPIRNAHRRGKIWFETNNRLTFVASSLARVYPRSRFVVLSRNPVAFAESAMARGYYESHPWDHARIRPSHEDPAASGWSDMSQLEKVGWLWAETYRTALNLLDQVGPDRGLAIRSENLFATSGSSAVVVARLFDFVGVEAPSQRQIRRVMSLRANSQSDRPAGSAHQAWPAPLRAAFDRQVEAVAQRMDEHPLQNSK